MQTSYFTLVGFVFTTLCASFCPMNMDIGMDMSGMQMMAQMDMGGEKDMPCERCEQSAEEVAISDATIDIQTTAQAPYAIVALTPSYTDALFSHPSGLPLANAGPPPLAKSLVGTVIFRT